MKTILRKIRRSLFPWRANKSFTRNRPEYSKYDIGEYTYGAPTIHDFNEKLTIGKFCSIAPGVTIILGGNHQLDFISTYPFAVKFPEVPNVAGNVVSKGPLEIGHDVWIGASAIILSGLKIGNGAVIAAGSVITKDVPPYTIVGGNPAAIIKARFDAETIAKLEALKWWDKDISEIKKIMPDLNSKDISTLTRSVH